MSYNSWRLILLIDVFRTILVIAFNIIGNLYNMNNTVAIAIIGTLGSPTFLCILGSRMFFNLKEAAEHGVNIGTNWSSYSHSAIHFEQSQAAENT